MPVTNGYGQSVGDDVPGWSGARAPGPVVLTGRWVRVEPLSTSHGDALFGATGAGTDPTRWTYLAGDPQPVDRDELVRAIGERVADPGSRPFAIVPLEGPRPGSAAGQASYLRIDPENGSIEVGAINYGEELARTRAATEAMYLLARHAFEDLGYRRYEWKCDSLNERSRRAALRLGFRYEGRFRQAMVYRGRNRDTDWFSILDSEWPRLRAAYDAWLDPENFETDGRQRRSLRPRT
ncbi:MAG: GNAT family N-acetyltransferase [Nocardioides sp.]